MTKISVGRFFFSFFFFFFFFRFLAPHATGLFLFVCSGPDAYHGPYSKLESALVFQGMMCFIELHNLGDTPEEGFPHLFRSTAQYCKTESARLRSLAPFPRIANLLPKRSVESVYNHANTFYRPRPWKEQAYVPVAYVRAQRLTFSLCQMDRRRA